MNCPDDSLKQCLKKLINSYLKKGSKSKDYEQ